MCEIVRIYVRRYRDNGQVAAYCDWDDGTRTEETAVYEGDRRRGYRLGFGEHMHALLRRANRNGLKLARETW
ncbi:MAG: hypothetical protein KGJ13_09150 [Patescibacteria group bacterium]|nr:hypothetical protein [Patescibacteria group bacterium]